jgi:hypothetical protein
MNTFYTVETVIAAVFYVLSFFLYLLTKLEDRPGPFATRSVVLSGDRAVASFG